MEFAVHLFPTVRVKVTGITANSVAEALAKAEASVNMHEVLDNPRPRAGNVEHIEWDEGANSFALVDQLDSSGQVMEDASRWLDGDGNPLVDGKTALECQAGCADAAGVFMDELIGSVAELSDIAQEHGPRTLSDLMHLAKAILQNGSIVNYPAESSVMEIVKRLPSGARWATFVRA